jgi:hypothetical protein
LAKLAASAWCSSIVRPAVPLQVRRHQPFTLRPKSTTNTPCSGSAIDCAFSSPATRTGSLFCATKPWDLPRRDLHVAPGRAGRVARRSHAPRSLRASIVSPSSRSLARIGPSSELFHCASAGDRDVRAVLEVDLELREQAGLRCRRTRAAASRRTRR